MSILRVRGKGEKMKENEQGGGLEEEKGLS